MLADPTTLPHFLIEEQRRHPAASGELNSLVLDVAIACAAIATQVARGALGGMHAAQGTTDVQGEVPSRCRRGRYLLLFDPLDGSSNVDLGVAAGSIFSIVRARAPGTDAAAADLLQPGVGQVCAGYAIYGPSTMLVLTVGRGVYGFTLDPRLGEFILTHPSITIPAAAREFAINAADSRFWGPAVTRYVDECLAGSTGPRGADFTMRWVASLVAEAHHILLRGGVFLCPRDGKEPAGPGRVRLLHEANPVAFLVEQAGGAASTGYARTLDVRPEHLHQRIGLVFGAREEVERIERYHRDQNVAGSDAPLYGSRGLFRTA